MTKGSETGSENPFARAAGPGAVRRAIRGVVSTEASLRPRWVRLAPVERKVRLRLVRPPTVGGTGLASPPPPVIRLPSLGVARSVARPRGAVTPSSVLRVLGPEAGRVIRLPRSPLVLSTSRYRFDRILGDGGTSTVFLAMDLRARRPVAIKILKPAFRTDPEAIRRLKEEARLAMRLNHPHIVRLYDLGRAGPHYVIVMEYVEGLSLRAWLEQHGPPDPASVLDVVDVCSEALTYAHGIGILHNDLKPDNLMLSSQGVLKIVDFGTANFVGRASDGLYILGTPAYMSPEQVRGEALDVRTDVYALGMTAYELLTGRLPYARDASQEEVLAHRRAPLDGLPAPMLAVLEKAIAPDRTARFATPRQFRDALWEAAAESGLTGAP